MIHVTMPILHGACTGLFIGGGATALGVIVATVAPDRGASVSDITDAAAARESRGERLPAHARKLRETIQ